VVLCNQVPSIDRRRLVKRIGVLTTGTMQRVERALLLSLGILNAGPTAFDKSGAIRFMQIKKIAPSGAIGEARRRAHGRLIPIRLAPGLGISSGSTIRVLCHRYHDAAER